MTMMHVANSAHKATKLSLQYNICYQKSTTKICRIAELYSLCKQHGSQRRCQFLLSSTQTQHQVKCGLLLDVVVSQGATILKLLSSKDQTLLVRGNTCKQASQTQFLCSSVPKNSHSSHSKQTYYTALQNNDSKRPDSKNTILEQQSLFWSVLLTLLVLDLALDIVNGV